ncbi:hypothetical protein OZ379_000680 [Salmonella enterica]|uniref:hypothetical protein n=1 Tax=Salmonella enterica TaxID=28901 RepID=UPI000402BB7B|nr:hypothetical protein [Salmonella enterica]EBR3855367.1 hypothetical protein [Salmonella enterica subsp. enterica]ECJ2706686.1 hypothetical protein [Salmonella enterica subsp. diarizonae]EDD5837495.1 hypothetical protein [Salmonella enterica subsp. enterica serovar Enteritidis]EGE4751155.1 hypothetical protein [Salmonella enterica subsp. diarizonae serovar 38:[k]:z35]SUG60191.1 Uncharacterised protein [Salmonella enterica subsp. arizonae]HAF0277534.1 hypothetical protein [Salmonella enteric
MNNSEINDMIIYYSRLMTGKVVTPLYLNYAPDDFNSELRLLLLSVNDGIIKGRVISAMLDKTENVIPDEIIDCLEKKRNELREIRDYLKLSRSSWHKKEKKNEVSVIIDEAVNFCNQGGIQMEELIHKARKTRCLLWLHP